MTILIISQDKDFSATVAEQVRRELGIPCEVAENNEAAKALMGQAALIVTSDPQAEIGGCPVIAVRNIPVRLRDLLAQIQAMLHKPTSVALGRGYGLQPRQKQLTYGGKAVDLTDKEVQLLQSLAEAGSRGVSREQLLKNVWGIEAALNTHTLETHIYRLRSKCKELAGEELIEAIEGGYQLT